MKKYRIISFLGLIVLLLAFWNCSETPKSTEPNFSTENPIFSLYPVVSPNGLLIYPDNAVKDVNGNLIGVFDGNGNVLDEYGTVIEIGIDKENLFLLTPIGFVVTPQGVVTDMNGEILGMINEFGLIVLLDGSVVDGNGQIPPPPVSSSSEEGIPPPVSSSSIEVIPPTSSSSVIEVVPSSSSKVVVPSSSSKVVVPSSSSVVVKPSSSSAPPANTCPNLSGISGNKKDGWGSRYWDCCKPHCSWQGNTSTPCKTCDANHNEIGLDGKSGCEGGDSYVCLSQAPYQVCDNMSFGFAAVPAADAASCGKCYLITFTGEGRYSTNDNHRAVKGKQMVVITSNIGGDVDPGQFDIMIPGGGVGQFNGCSRQWGVDNSQMGEQYGGLLSSCENELGYNATKTQYKSCLEKKCRSLFSKPELSQGLQGCLWHVNWLEAANNPKFTYQEVNCPQELTNKYRSLR